MAIKNPYKKIILYINSYTYKKIRLIFPGIILMIATSVNLILTEWLFRKISSLSIIFLLCANILELNSTLRQFYLLNLFSKNLFNIRKRISFDYLKIQVIDFSTHAVCFNQIHIYFYKRIDKNLVEGEHLFYFHQHFSHCLISYVNCSKNFLLAYVYLDASE